MDTFDPDHNSFALFVVHFTLFFSQFVDIPLAIKEEARSKKKILVTSETRPADNKEGTQTKVHRLHRAKRAFFASISLSTLWFTRLASLKVVLLEATTVFITTAQTHRRTRKNLISCVKYFPLSTNNKVDETKQFFFRFSVLNLKSDRAKLGESERNRL